MEILYCLTAFLHCCKCCVFNLEDMAHLATLVTSCITIIALMYTELEYKNHVKQTKISVLSKYNERYCNSPEIARVIKYIMKCLDYNDGECHINPEKIRTYQEMCEEHDKEVFMRFFEEIQISIDNALLDTRYVKKMFAFYAEKAGEMRTEFVDDYEKDYWYDFRRFVENMNKLSYKIE